MLENAKVNMESWALANHEIYYKVELVCNFE
jgi:hypothetical protein